MRLLRRRHAVIARKFTTRGATGRGGGAWRYMQNPVFHRGTSNEVAGLYPFILGSSSPLIGVPIGRVRRKNTKGAVICCDPVSWFERASLINQPSAFILGLPALGKSTLIKRWIMGLDYYGVKSLVLGDLKGEYVELIKALGGQIISVGRGRGYINVLDMGEVHDAVQRLRDAGFIEEANSLLAEAKGRRQAAMETLLTIHRSTPPEARESSIVSEALRVLDIRITRRVPVIGDLLKVVKNPTPEMHKVAVSRGSLDRYREITERLEADLESLAAGHGIGEIFSRQTTTQMKRGQHVVFNVKFIDETDTKMQAAALMLCWGIGFGQISIGNFLADCGLEAQQNVHVIMDELWRALRTGAGLVDRSDGLTRLNRDKGVAVTYASHAMEDMSALPTEEDRAKAIGMVERCGMVIAFGLPASQMPRLSKAVHLSNIEQKTLNSWTTPPSLSQKLKKKKKAPPGQGKCLIKIANHPGVQVDIDLVDMEKKFNRTSARWAA